MLAKLKADGFDALTPSTPTASSMRRTRRRRDTEGVAALAALGESMVSPGGSLRDESDTTPGTPPAAALDSIDEYPSSS
ncbi:hypothetical protein ONZ51_g13071 [Trametes cubensis]|uniref:Uncharacterized protein n=1 Tax=Trametes cubensis TaxID=1111947 RepID=A0AAD7X3A6_9APHY|nr:hypothetical protein ONZ51_g13071 [Trametes cubensis]